MILAIHCTNIEASFTAIGPSSMHENSPLRCASVQVTGDKQGSDSFWARLCYPMDGKQPPKEDSSWNNLSDII
jgi:hypothetical protein